ncbi:hypothetical protein BDZ45DRAFT_749671 [Acephala macrosclerotiorum]|nr:hypothetical protein BDZ45DRAFT_749671 [Acephala macrosclerotiorum]
MSSGGGTVYAGYGDAGSRGFAGPATGGRTKGGEYGQYGIVGGFPAPKPRGSKSRPPVSHEGTQQGGQGRTQ